MKIVVVSRSWPTNEHSGLSLLAAEHVRMLSHSGHDVHIVGAYTSVAKTQLPVVSSFCIKTFGSSAFPLSLLPRFPHIIAYLSAMKPDLVVLEAWQTALTESFLRASHACSIPTLMISHGVSVHPFSPNLREFVRSLFWSYYRKFVLPRQLSKLSALTALDLLSQSPRFYDRDLALLRQTPVFELANVPLTGHLDFVPCEERLYQILTVGYYSRVKNQLSAINLMPLLPRNVTLLLVGPKFGSYYLRCRERVIALGLEARIKFLEDSECSLGFEMSRSRLLLMTSITEALPVTLLEAMSMGTPYVATSVGAIPSLGGGIIADTKTNQMQAICRLLTNSSVWKRYSDRGLKACRLKYSHQNIRHNLLNAVEFAVNAGVVLA